MAKNLLHRVSLKELLLFLQAIFARKSWISRRVQADERLTRYIFDERHIKGEEVKGAACEPPKSLPEVSVYRTNGLGLEAIWRIGLIYVESLRGKKMVALTHTTSNLVKGQELSVQPLWLPHPRHTNILGWPEERSAAKQKALELARDAKAIKPT